MAYRVGKLGWKKGEIAYGNNAWKVTDYWP